MLYCKLYSTSKYTKTSFLPDLFPEEHPTHCLLYVVSKTILYPVLNTIINTVLYTKLYTVLYTVPYTIFYTNAKVAGWDGLIPKEHFPSSLYYIVAEHRTVQCTLHSNVDCTVQHNAQCTVYCFVLCTLSPNIQRRLFFLPSVDCYSTFILQCTVK